MSTAIYFDGNASTGLTTTTGLPSINHTACFFASIDQIVANNFGAFYELVQNIGGPANLVEISVDTDGATVSVFSQAAPSGASVLKMVVGVWYFFAVVQSGSTVTLFGKPVGAPTCSVATIAADTGWTAGGLSLGIEFFPNAPSLDDPLSGSMCSVRIWSNVALSQAELERESEQLTPVRTADLFAYWPLTSDKDLRDATARGSLLTPQSTAHVFQRSGPPLPEVRTVRRPRFGVSAGSSAIFEEDFPWSLNVTASGAPLILAMDEELPSGFGGMPEEWTHPLPLLTVAGAGSSPPMDEEFVQQATVPPVFDEYAPAPILFAAPSFSQTYTWDEDLAQTPPPPTQAPEEWAPVVDTPMAVALSLLYTNDEEFVQQVTVTPIMEEWAPHFLGVTSVWAQPSFPFDEEHAAVPSSIAFEEYAPPPALFFVAIVREQSQAFTDEEYFLFVPPTPSTGIIFFNRPDMRRHHRDR